MSFCIYELEGGNIELTGTIPSGIRNYPDLWVITSSIKTVNISDTNIIPDSKLCAKADCGVSFISTLKPPSPFASITSSIQDFLSARFCIKVRILTDIGGRTKAWKITALEDDVVVMSDAVLRSLRFYNTKKCLPRGCYKLTIFEDDSAGFLFSGYFKLFINNRPKPEFHIGSKDGLWSIQNHIFCDPSSDYTQTLSPSMMNHPTNAPASSSTSISMTMTPSISYQPTIVPIPADDLFSNQMNILPPDEGSFSADEIVVDVSESYIVVGNPQARNNTGHAYIYSNAGSYMLTIEAYDGNENDFFGRSISTYGDLVIIGAPAAKIKMGLGLT